MTDADDVRRSKDGQLSFFTGKQLETHAPQPEAGEIETYRSWYPRIGDNTVKDFTRKLTKPNTHAQDRVDSKKQATEQSAYHQG
jgi:hypothetical protein